MLRCRQIVSTLESGSGWESGSVLLAAKLGQTQGVCEWVSNLKVLLDHGVNLNKIHVGNMSCLQRYRALSGQAVSRTRGSSAHIQVPLWSLTHSAALDELCTQTHKWSTTNPEKRSSDPHVLK